MPGPYKSTKCWLIFALIAVAVCPAESSFYDIFINFVNMFFPYAKPQQMGDGLCLEPNAGVDTHSLYGMYDSFENHPCKRECQEGVHMVCYYHLYIHNYRTMGPECDRCHTDEMACDEERCIYRDGEPSTIKVVNHRLPSSTINVCYNDTVVAIIYNNLEEGTTQHWHGFHMATNPQSDGAPLVTQYPIMPGEKRDFRFLVDKPGTYWYHSHMSGQRAEGVAGMFISRLPDSLNPHIALYDYDLSEHALMFQDCNYNGKSTPPLNLIINGKGRNPKAQLPYDDVSNRYERIYVNKDYCYRIRAVSNAISNCPMEVSVQGHSLLVIALDGNDIKPVKADRFHFHAGERVDFVLCTKQNASAYWIYVKGMNDCVNLTQRAILQYAGTSKYEMPLSLDPIENTGVCVNTLWEAKDVGAVNGTNLATVDFQSLDPIPWPDTTEFHKVYLQLGVAVIKNEVSLQMNHIKYIPPALSMLQAGHMVDMDKVYCNASTFEKNGIDCKTNMCSCTHVIRIPENTHVQFVISNLMGTSHPIHLHGYTYYLTAQGVLNGVEETSRIEELDRANDPRLKRLNTTLSNPVRKDVAQVPPHGFTKFEVRSDNPGPWLMHCHIEGHALLGMTIAIFVGDQPNMQDKVAKYEL